MSAEYNDRYSFILKVLLHLFHINVLDRYGRKIIAKYAKEEILNRNETSILDIAAGGGSRS